MIDCVRIGTSHNFAENILVEQHRLRYREVIDKENWRDVYTVDEMEFDQYDNLATEYFVARDGDGKVVGVTRSYPTTIPYMLSEVFSCLIKSGLPASPKIFEASRLVLDRERLSKAERRPVVNELIVGYMERGLQRGIDAYIGFMLPKIWESTFERAGWELEWLGPPLPLPGTKEIVRAGLMVVSEEMNRRVREATGIRGNVLEFGMGSVAPEGGVAAHSHERKGMVAA